MKLPIIDKQYLRNALPGEWMDRRVADTRKLVRITTSGSSGAPFEFLIDRHYDQIRKAQFLRPLITNGRGFFDTIVRLSIRDGQPSSWFQKLGLLREVYVSVLKSHQEQLDVIARVSPDIVYGYPSMLHALAQAMKERNVHYTPKRVFTDSELLLAPVRELLKKTFQADIIDIYGTYETENIAYECSHHTGYHIAIDHVVMEFIHNGAPVAPAIEGEIVCTVLDNFTTPFIRYNLHDRASYTDTKCPCGRSFPLMQVINGRLDDYLTTKNGEKKPFLGLYAIFSDEAPAIKEFQVVQEASKALRISIVPTQQYTATIGEGIVQKFNRALPGLDVTLTVRQSLERERSGKLRAFKSLVT